MERAAVSELGLALAGRRSRIGGVGSCKLKEKGEAVVCRSLLLVSHFSKVRSSCPPLLSLFCLNQALGSPQISSGRHDSRWVTPLIHWNRAMILPSCWLRYLGFCSDSF